MKALVLLLGLLLVPMVHAGPLEARKLLADARALPPKARWTTRVEAYRQAFLAAHPTDRLRSRVLAAMAGVLTRERLVHGALAARARAAWLGPERDRGRLGRLLDLALHLRREGDLDAARPHLEEVIRLGRTISRRHTDRALDALSEDLADRGDLEGLGALVAAHPISRSAPHVGLRISNRHGLLQLSKGDRKGAERAYAQALRLWRRIADLEGKEAIRCARIWLDFELRAALESQAPP